MPTLLRKIAYQAITDKSGSDNAQVPVNAPTVKVYKRGATVSANVTVLSSDVNKVVAVYDAGALVVGDEVQLGTSSSAYAVVAEITSRTSIKLNGNTGTLALLGPSGSNPGSRLVCRTNRPTVYDEITGVHAMAASPDVVASSTGKLNAFVRENIVDLIISGGSPTLTAYGEYDWPTDRIEHRVEVTDVTALARAIAALPAGGSLEIGPGVHETAVAIVVTAPDVRIVGDAAATTTIQPNANNPAYHLFAISGLIGGTVIENIGFNGRATAAGIYDVVQVVNPGSAAPFNTRLTGCSIYNAQRRGVSLLGCFDTMIRDTSIYQCYENGAFLDAVGSDNCTHAYFENSEINACDTDGDDFAAVKIDHALGATFAKCRFESNRGGQGAVSANGIHAKNALGLKVIGCHTEPRHAAGPYQIAGQPQQLMCLEDSAGALILGCTFDGGSTGALKPFYAIMAYGSKRGVWLGGRVDNIDQKFSHCDNGSSGWLIVDPDYGTGNVATTHSDNMLDRSIRIYNGVKVPRFADTTARDAAVSAGGANTDNGTIIYLKSTNKVQLREAGAWNDAI